MRPSEHCVHRDSEAIVYRVGEICPTLRTGIPLSSREDVSHRRFFSTTNVTDPIKTAHRNRWTNGRTDGWMDDLAITPNYNKSILNEGSWTTKHDATYVLEKWW